MVNSDRNIRLGRVMTAKVKRDKHGARSKTFGPNGVLLSELDDFQLLNEHGRKDFEVVVMALLGLLGSLLVSYCIGQIDTLSSHVLTFQICLLVTGALSLCSSFVFFGVQAGSAGQFSINWRAIQKHDADILPHRHISGFGAVIVVALLSFVLSAAFLGQRLHPNFKIPEIAGVWIIVGLCLAFGILIVSPRLTDFSLLSRIWIFVQRTTFGLSTIGRLLSFLDSILVYVVAPTVGASQTTWQRRYSILGGHLVGASVFAWFSSAPVGLVGILWALLATISMARRWSWIEVERDVLLREPDTPPEKIRLSLDGDLRDEALFGLLFMIFVLPIGMRQLHLWNDSALFSVDAVAQDSLRSWLGFFGVELVKALPFIDWSDIYGATGQTSIRTTVPAAMHTVFVARVIVDLVFLSSLLQAISISVSLSKHKKRFFDGDDKLTVLDPRIEKIELEKLAFKNKSGDWEVRTGEIKKFARYDTTRLSVLRIKSKKGSKLNFVVGEILGPGIKNAPLGERLFEIASRRNPNVNKLQSTLRSMRELGDFPLEYLSDTRKALNWKGGVEALRLEVVRTIINDVPAKSDVKARERADVLSSVIAGEDLDSLAPVRALVINEIGKNKRMATLALKSLVVVATSDKASSLKKRAASIIEKYDLGGLVSGELLSDAA